ncbi:MAG: hypothetical protein WCC04_15365 [Terriglobales bacterium]
MGSLLTKSLPCSVCGRNTSRRDGWFLVVENRWLDRLKIFTWHPSLASQPGFNSACSRPHLKVLIAFWLDQANLRLIPRADEPSPIAGDPRRDDVDLCPGASGRLLGELSVYRETFSRVWTGSPATLESIVEALIPAENADHSMASFQLFRPPHEPPYGISLH